jgi:hypothetical protein
MIELECETMVRVNESPTFLNGNVLIGTWTWYSVEDRLLFSDTFCQLTGIPKDSYYNFKTFFDIIHGNDLLQFLNNIEEVLLGAQARWIKVRITLSDNSDKMIYCYMDSKQTEFGDIFDITGVCFDITE